MQILIFFWLLILTAIVMVMTLLWSEWFQVTTVSKTLILNFASPEVGFVLFGANSWISIGVPWMLCVLCMSCFCVALTPAVLCSWTLQSSLFRTFVWKGEEPFGSWCGFLLPHLCRCWDKPYHRKSPAFVEAEGSVRSSIGKSGCHCLVPVPRHARWFECHKEAVKSGVPRYAPKTHLMPKMDLT